MNVLWQKYPGAYQKYQNPSSLSRQDLLQVCHIQKILHRFFWLYTAANWYLEGFIFFYLFGFVCLFVCFFKAERQISDTV